MNTYPSSLPAFLSRHLTKLSPGGLLLVVILAGVTGCSPTPPPKNQIDAAVTWSLSVHRVDKYEPNRRTNYFESYTIANKYIEKKDGKVSFVYDYAAQVPAAAGLWDGDRSKPIAWETPNGRYNLAGDETPTSDIRLFKVEGSVTLTRKGEAWYYFDTKR